MKKFFVLFFVAVPAIGITGYDGNNNNLVENNKVIIPGDPIFTLTGHRI